MSLDVRVGNATALDLPDESVHCIVTSPPYNVGIEYEGYDDNMPWGDYIEMLHGACREMSRVLISGGRAWVNVPPASPIEAGRGDRADLGTMWANGLSNHLMYRDTVVWHKNAHVGACQWGSWLSPSAPNMRGLWENVLCFFKGEWKRERPADLDPEWKAPRYDLGGDWSDLCRNVWNLQPSMEKYSPVPFPLDLPARCIRLSTWPGETVLDPFGGGGTTAEAADILMRHGISIDISPQQTQITKDRLTTLFGGT